MAWIELHQNLATHRKLLRLKALLSLKTPQAVGHLCLIWLWAVDNAPDGDISSVSAKELSQVAEFNPRKAEDFREALIAAGFLDREGERIFIHDWDRYGGRYQSIREKNTERQRRYREKQKSRVTNAEITPQQDRTEQDKTGQNITGQINLSADDGVSAQAGGERLAEYLLGRWLSPADFIGAEKKDIDEAFALCGELFGKFTLRNPTDFDRAKLFSLLWTRQGLTEEQTNLVCYAFEQAAAAGKGGNWQYIEGVLTRLAGRGIRTLKEAEMFDLERTDSSLRSE